MPTHERDSSSAFCSQEGEVEVESLIEFLVKCKRNVRVLHSSYRTWKRKKKKRLRIEVVSKWFFTAIAMNTSMARFAMKRKQPILGPSPKGESMTAFPQWSTDASFSYTFTRAEEPLRLLLFAFNA